MKRSDLLTSVAPAIAALVLSSPSARTQNVSGWGLNSSGQLGLPALGLFRAPTTVPGMPHVVAVSAGVDHTLFLGVDGTVWSAGVNTYGEVGRGKTGVVFEAPGKVSGLANVKAIAAGGHFSLALTTDGRVWAWGRNNYGQLGIDAAGDQTAPAGVGQYVLIAGRTVFRPLTNIKAISAGSNHALVLTASGKVYSWGSNVLGQLGIGSTTNQFQPAYVDSLANAKAIAAGGVFSLVLLANGTLKSFGYNENGSLGIGTSTGQKNVPVDVTMTGMLFVTSIAAGSSHALAITWAGDVWAWGSNNRGQLGLGDTTERTVPTKLTIVSMLPVCRGIAAGSDFSVVWSRACQVYAFGGNGDGQLGDGTTTDSHSPVYLPSLHNIKGVAAGSWHAFAIVADAPGWAWGQNNSGQLAYGSPLMGSPDPVRISADMRPLLVSAGVNHSIGVWNGQAYTWGKNDHGQIGDNSLDDRFTIFSVPGVTPSTTVAAAGRQHSVALGSLGGVWSWGSNEYGQLGDETNTDSQEPTNTHTLPPVIGVSAGNEHSVALYGNGSVTTWGRDSDGQLGDGGTGSRNLPYTIPGLTDIIQISAGGLFTLALAADGTVWAWGDNQWGQIGNGNNVDQRVPVQVSGLANIIAIEAGSLHSLALRSDGEVYAWGDNNNAQLGDGTEIRSNIPVRCGTLTNVVSVSSGGAQSLAVTADGRLWGWGGNTAGELGRSPAKTYAPTLFSPLEGVIAVSGGQQFTLAIAVGPLFTLPDAVTALRISGGLEEASESQLSMYNVVTDGMSYNKVEVVDAVAIARKAVGLEQNP